MSNLDENKSENEHEKSDIPSDHLMDKQAPEPQEANQVEHAGISAMHASALAPTLLSLVGGEEGSLQTDDVLGIILPLFKQVAAFHEQGLVMGWTGIGSLNLSEHNTLALAGSGIAPTKNKAKLDELQGKVSNAFRVGSYAQVTSDDVIGTTYASGDVAEKGQELQHPAYIAGYGCWDQEVGHHDALTDILLLGQILASLSLGLDFTELSDLSVFAACRTNLFRLNPRINPVISSIIVEMTELNRQRRAADLAALIFRLETYREQAIELDVSQIPGFRDAGLKARRRLLQERLRERLFEISKRNKLLYFKPSQSALNLTVASVPLVLKIASIKLEDLFLWHKPLSDEIISGGAINLRRWLRFEDQSYLPSALDKLISDTRRDRAEFGFAQLRLVVAFLHWHNLKESENERITSPLLLLPVELAKKKGVKDQYTLQVTASEAEVNPVLRHHLNQLYGLHLPETVDLSQTSAQDFHDVLQSQIHASEPSVTLRLLDKPEIQLIHAKARQRLSKFQKNQRLRASAYRPKSSFGYSYEQDNLKPLGLQLFREKVKPKALPQRDAVGGISEERIPYMVSPATEEAVIETERLTYALTSDSGGNPYTWDFDLCSLTLGNFNYRKMSLVRDYSLLLEDDHSSKSFDLIFSIDPKALSNEEEKAPPLKGAESWTIAPGDATQAAAVAFARTGRSCIIQGPPGTGKSQTITNLIADFVALGKKVLFVCEKRAAIDVVFHRLRQRGLDDLCCLIHDSQADKKAFIQNLKQTYESWIAHSDGLETASKQRAQKLQGLAQDLDSLARFDQVMRSQPAHLSVTVRELLARLATSSDLIPPLDPSEIEQLPSLAVWDEYSHLAQRISTILGDISHTSILAAHPFRWLGSGVLIADRPLQKLSELSERTEELIESIANKFETSGLPRQYWCSANKMVILSDLCEQLGGLASREQLALLDSKSTLSRELDQFAASIKALEKSLEQCRTKTAFWLNKLSASDVTTAINQARADEHSALRWCKPSWWRLRGTMLSSYDFKKHAVRPSYLQLLTDLDAEYAAISDLEKALAVADKKFGGTPSEVLDTIASIQANAFSTSSLLELRSSFQQDGGSKLVTTVRELRSQIHEFSSIISQLLEHAGNEDLESLGEIVRDLNEESDSLPEIIPALSELNETPPAFAYALRQFALPPEKIEAAVAHSALELVYRTERWLPKFDGRMLTHKAARVSNLAKAILKDNAAVIRSTTHHNFRERVQISSMSATQLDTTQKRRKKSYSAGRRDLEHEFGKSMRYKSIRDLVAGESGVVVRDLKPVWLMSPLSVSDTLPLDPNLFDVIIFDEASQITVEEAVPALHRAPQVIVVGDEMQLPPTRFFSTAKETEDESFELQEDGERFMVSLDADSLLAQSARNLPSSLLAWHYRSRSESLIGFSNAAFYAGNLYTIPDRIRNTDILPEIVVQSAEDAKTFAGLILERPISFHLMERSPYIMRRNSGEAAYIAQLVAELLAREDKLSIGIVAFSEAQQSEIESALDFLASRDAEFSRRLEEEYSREEDDQFCGLFVKNLENVQGDERDIIILSICYGPDESGKMLMNFGPVNQRGGEKRLNVIFSRAKQHMAIVSSIRHTAITNDYNEGAAALKNFLHYAQVSSIGQNEIARSILESLNPLTRSSLVRFEHDSVVSELAEALRKRGYEVDEQVGQSRFRCDLGVAHPAGPEYAVGIIVDTSDHYKNIDLMERFITQPDILRSFGWRVALVLTRDWYHERQNVIDRIARMMDDRNSTDGISTDDNFSDDSLLDEEIQSAAQPDLAIDAVSSNQEPSHAISTAAAIGAALPPASHFRRFEFAEGNANKFWEIAREDRAVTVRFGRIGTTGQTKTTLFDSGERASKETEKLVAEKLRKGYNEKVSAQSFL